MPITQQLAAALRACIAREGDYLALADAALADHEAQANALPSDGIENYVDIITAADARYGKVGELDIDEDPQVEITDTGAWVEAWVFVPNDQIKAAATPA